MKWDSFDMAILAALAEDARMPLASVAERIALSSSAVSRRLDAMEKAGLVRGYHANLDKEMLGFPLIVIVEVRLNTLAREDLDAFEEAVRKLDFVSECFLMSGEADYHLRLYARSMEHFESLHRGALSQLPGVARLTTAFVMRKVSSQHATVSAKLALSERDRLRSKGQARSGV